MTIKLGFYEKNKPLSNQSKIIKNWGPSGRSSSYVIEKSSIKYNQYFQFWNPRLSFMILEGAL